MVWDTRRMIVIFNDVQYRIEFATKTVHTTWIGEPDGVISTVDLYSDMAKLNPIIAEFE
jgi:hypothetical protein